MKSSRCWQLIFVWGIVWVILLIISTLFSAEVIVASSIIFGFTNVLLQEKIWGSFSLTISETIRNLTIVTLIVYIMGGLVFGLGCQFSGFQEFVMFMSEELDFCSDYRLQTVGISFLFSISLVVSLLFGFARIYEKKHKI